MELVYIWQALGTSHDGHLTDSPPTIPSTELYVQRACNFAIFSEWSVSVKTQNQKNMQTTNYIHVGTPFVYQGQELGMVHPKDWKIEDYKDVETMTCYKEYITS